MNISLQLNENVLLKPCCDIEFISGNKHHKNEPPFHSLRENREPEYQKNPLGNAHGNIITSATFSNCQVVS